MNNIRSSRILRGKIFKTPHTRHCGIEPQLSTNCRTYCLDKEVSLMNKTNMECVIADSGLSITIGGVEPHRQSLEEVDDYC